MGGATICTVEYHCVLLKARECFTSACIVCCRCEMVFFISGFLARYLCVLQYHIKFSCLITCYTRISPSHVSPTSHHAFFVPLCLKPLRDPSIPTSIHLFAPINQLHLACAYGVGKGKFVCGFSLPIVFMLIIFLHIPFNSSVFFAVCQF